MNYLSHTSIQVTDIIRQTATTQIMPLYIERKLMNAREKQPGDWVTDGDINAEKFLTDKLSRLFPQARIIGEESVDANSTLLANTNSGLVIFIDPIDGTSVYRQGLPGFATMVTVVKDGVSQAGYIFDICANQMLVGERGRGVWFHGGKNAIFEKLTTFARRDDPNELHGLIGLEGFKEEFRFTDNFLDRKTRNETLVAWNKWGSSTALVYKKLIMGEENVSTHLGAATKPWDHSAGALMVEVLGGAVHHLNNRPYSPCRFEGGVIAATSADLLEQILIDTIPPVSQWTVPNPCKEIYYTVKEGTKISPCPSTMHPPQP